jgi:hypothetical protein
MHPLTARSRRATPRDKLLLRGPLLLYPRSPFRAGLRERLAANYVHPNAEHTRRFLAEPALAMRDVVAMGARRPTTPDLLAEIAASARWARHAEVREALVFNPFTPASIAARLLPTLPVLRRARGAMELDPRVREMARLLLGA